MMEKEFVVRNRSGLHVRPSNILAELCKKYTSSITVSKDGVAANAASILDLLTLCAVQGSLLKFTVTGEDETQAMAEVEGLFNSNFGEK